LELLMERLATMMLRALPDHLDPDQSEIRELLHVAGASLAHCTLPPSQTTKAVTHRTVEEVWYVLHGSGQVWRKLDTAELVIDAVPGTCLTIPHGTHFQFRNPGAEPFVLLIATAPPWPGADEAVPVPDYW